MKHLKYAIQQKLDALPHAVYRNSISELLNHLKISKRTFHRYLTTKVGDQYSIRTDQLLIIANYLKCNAMELINRPDPKSVPKPKITDPKVRNRLYSDRLR